MSPEPAAVVATTTTPDRPLAEGIARALVERRLAACVQIVDPIQSCYWWEGAVQEDPEVLLIIKTVDTLVPAVESLLEELHPYEVPELIAVPASGGSQAYRQWILESVRERRP